MANCWVPHQPAQPNWDGEGDRATDKWTPGIMSDSRACIAVACYMVACVPREKIVYTGAWEDAWVCGEEPEEGIPQPGEGENLTAFDSGFNLGFK